MEYEGDGYTVCNWRAWNGRQRLGKQAKRVENQRTNRDHPNYSINQIGQNIEKSRGDLKRLAVTQIPLKDHQLTIV